MLEQEIAKIPERVAVGEAQLDTALAGRLDGTWFRLVDIDFLDMGDGNCCMLGQLADYVSEEDGFPYYDFGDIAAAMAWDKDETVAYGFEAPPTIPDYNDEVAYYDALDKAWRERIIAQRQAEDAQ